MYELHSTGLKMTADHNCRCFDPATSGSDSRIPDDSKPHSCVWLKDTQEAVS